MMKAILSRTYYNDETTGIFLVVSGATQLYKCFTVELPNLANQKNISCIPEGTYIVKKHISPSKGNCFHILDVPNRENILIHKGNFVAGYKIDSEGCILVGNYLEDINGDGHIDVAESKKALDKLLEILPDEFELHII